MSNRKNIVTIGLLVLVAAAVATAVLKQPRKEAADAGAATQTTVAALPQNGLVAMFFHGETRCPTCRNIERLAHQAIVEGFGNELASGKIQWRTINYETPDNSHYATDYEIFS